MDENVNLVASVKTFLPKRDQVQSTMELFIERTKNYAELESGFRLAQRKLDDESREYEHLLSLAKMVQDDLVEAFRAILAIDFFHPDALARAIERMGKAIHSNDISKPTSNVAGKALTLARACSDFLDWLYDAERDAARLENLWIDVDDSDFKHLYVPTNVDKGMLYQRRNRVAPTFIPGGLDGRREE